MTTPTRHPVVWAPTGNRIGHATPHAGALKVAAKVPVERFERRTATLHEDLDGVLTWFCGPQMARTPGSHRTSRTSMRKGDHGHGD